MREGYEGLLCVIYHFIRQPQTALTRSRDNKVMCQGRTQGQLHYGVVVWSMYCAASLSAFLVVQGHEYFIVLYCMSHGN